MRILLLCVFVSSCASWTTAEKYEAGLALVASAADGYTTASDIAPSVTCWEQNPILGQHPSTGKITWYFLGTAALDALIAELLPVGYRDAWLLWLASSEGFPAVRNERKNC